MALASYRKKLELNPELEALRNKALNNYSTENNEWIIRIIRKTSRIHAGFLFEDLKTLQNLCLFISETQNKITDAGWESFGYHLGLSPSILKVINYNNFNKEDPCYNVLLAYAQYDNASIGKILNALRLMGRIDVLSRIRTSINELADIICKYKTEFDITENSTKFNEESSDYESSTSNSGTRDINVSLIEELSNQELLKPKIIPPAPLIFQNIQATPEFTSQQIQKALKSITLTNKIDKNSNSELEKIYQNINEKIPCRDDFLENHQIKLVYECVQNQSITDYNKKNLQSSSKQRYGVKILLTFAEDGERYANEVCKVFRKNRDNFPKIGVLRLSEHAALVNKDPQQFISGAFFQVDYVCPILTAGYFDLISKKQKATSLSNIHIDATFVPYIFRLMNSYFVSNDCLNDKVRCIIPESEFSSLSIRNLWTNPVFGAWVEMGEVDDLAVRMLKKKTFIK